MTPPTATRRWVTAVRPIASATLRSATLIAIAGALILGLLPMAFAAAGPLAPIPV